MSKDIKVGDLVMVIKPTYCCSNPKSIGYISKVKSLNTRPYIKCQYCGELRKEGLDILLEDGAVQKTRLIKIDPPKLPETINHDEELKV